MTVVVLLVGGLLAAAISALSWRMAAAVFASPVLQRTNHRGVEIPVATGVVMVLAVVVVAAVASGCMAHNRTPLPAPRSPPTAAWSSPTRISMPSATTSRSV